jgi:Cupredoxin-like domain
MGGKGDEMTMFGVKLVGGAFLSAFSGATLLAGSAFAEDASLSLSIKDHRFSPAEIRAPANTAITLTVKNLDKTPEEFESKPLRVEKVIAGGGETTIRIRPLSPGKYRFFGDYNEATAEGFLIVE